MFDIPFWVLAAIYAVGVIIFLIWGFFYMFLMVRFGLFDGRGRLYTGFFLVFTVANLGLVSLALFQIDWFQTIPFPPAGFNLTPPGFSL